MPNFTVGFVPHPPPEGTPLKIRICLTALTLTLSAAAAVPAHAADDTHVEGQLPSGAAYLMDVPAGWNGTVLLYSHGYSAVGQPNPAQDSPSPATRDKLLAEGYALIGSSYATNGWAVTDAVPDQLATLDLFTEKFGTARRTHRLGHGRTAGSSRRPSPSGTPAASTDRCPCAGWSRAASPTGTAPSTRCSPSRRCSRPARRSR